MPLQFSFLPPRCLSRFRARSVTKCSPSNTKFSESPHMPLNSLEILAEKSGTCLLARGEMLCCAESCTGGWVAQTLTAIAGSSNWFERGFVTYSNAAKTELLGVEASLIETQGAVSEAVARAMALGALAHSPADWSVAITGIAGPSGGSIHKPVGTVCFAWAHRDGECEVQTCHFTGDRAAVREQSVDHALQILLNHLQSTSISA